LCGGKKRAKLSDVFFGVLWRASELRQNHLDDDNEGKKMYRKSFLLSVKLSFVVATR
jgi:hypothetical protein